MHKNLHDLRIQFASPRPITEEEKRTRQEQAKLGNWHIQFLLAQHSSRVTFLLAVLFVARMAVKICGSIFKSCFVNLHEPVARGRWVALVYAILSTSLTTLTVLTVLLEINLHLLSSLSSNRRLFEILVFGPVSLVLTALEFRRWTRNDHGGPVLIFI